MVGEAGVSPAYFFRKMSTAEIEDVLQGVARRERAGWEQTRILAGLYYGAKTGEELRWKFPWDEREQEPTAEEMDELRLRARKMEKLINKERSDGEE